LISEIKAISLLLDSVVNKGIVLDDVLNESWTIEHARRIRLYKKVETDFKYLSNYTVGSLKIMLSDQFYALEKKFKDYERWIRHLLAAEEILSGKRKEVTCYCTVLALRVYVKERLIKARYNHSRIDAIGWLISIESILTKEIERTKAVGKTPNEVKGLDGDRPY